jgi:polyisoprenoid-binding protein YceI
MTWKVDPTHSTIEFRGKHMLVATVKGRFRDWQMDADVNENDIAASHGVIRIDAASVDTGVPQRDDHLRSADFFDAEKHPAIVFATRRIVPKGGHDYRVVGDLTIRDVTREVTFDGEINGPMKDPWGGKRIGFSAETAINRKDWGLAWNVALEAGGILVGDTIKLSIDAELVEAA